MLKKIKTSSLTLEMHINKFCGPWLDHPFWRSNFTLSAESDIQRIAKSNMTEVIIDTEKGCDVTPLEALPEQDVQLVERPPQPDPEQIPFNQELSKAIKVYAQSKQAMRSMFDDVRMGRAVDVESAKAIVNQISESVMNNSGALISVVRLKKADEYTYMHSVAVSALMIALADAAGLNVDETKEAGLAGLLHDVGKAKIPSEITNKAGALTDEEYQLMKSHPEEGYKILQEHYSVSEPVLDVCLHHHEKIDGSGYPHGLVSERIKKITKIASICDVYDAITSNRPYKKGWNPAEAIRRMSQWTGHFDQSLFQMFVKIIGIYPIGSFVKLQSGKMGVVYEQNSESLLTPRVNVFFCAKTLRFVTPKIYDLSDRTTDDHIIGPEDPKQWGISNTQRYWVDE
ncbi:MAG: HD-GYP domain-containing protein [Porticoccaceae bacterium]|nr:HD-GYP domain-containing protein [Porticoccaceae bacterium]